MTDLDKQKVEVLNVMQAINRAWRESDFDGFEQFFREDVIMAMPGFEQKVEGRQALCDSYRQFAANSTIHEYTEGEPSIDILDNVAVVTYSFTMDYEVESGRYEESGRDLYLFIRDDEGWKAAWRTMMS